MGDCNFTPTNKTEETFLATQTAWRDVWTRLRPDEAGSTSPTEPDKRIDRVLLWDKRGAGDGAAPQDAAPSLVPTAIRLLGQAPLCPSDHLALCADFDVVPPLVC